MFVKSTNELWLHLRDPKDNYDIILVDLSKRELQIEQVLQTIRRNERYGLLPIVALSAHAELPDVVHQVCSYAVPLPASNLALREAFVWCFSRRSVTKVDRSAEASTLAIEGLVPR